MFKSNSDNSKKTGDQSTQAINLIGNGTSIIGDIETAGDIRIDGKLEGSLNIKGKLVVGATGHIKGKITCQNADISGNIEGVFKVSELLSLKSTSTIIGELHTAKLSVEPGATIDGSCTMTSKNNTHSIVRKEQQKAAV
jgi:cytoskeletal protein CcmA (bactofilin family)